MSASPKAPHLILPVVLVVILAPLVWLGTRTGDEGPAVGATPAPAAVAAVAVTASPAAADAPAAAGQQPAPSPPEAAKPAAAAKLKWPPEGGRTDEPPNLDRFGTGHKTVCSDDDWYSNDLAAAEQKAKDTGKVILYIFEASDCKHCRYFSEVMLADPEMCGIFHSDNAVVVKRFHDKLMQGKFEIKATPTFRAAKWVDGAWQLDEHIPGLLEPELMKKRLRDAIAGRGRLGRFRDALKADPNHQETLRVLLEEFRDTLTPREKITYVDRAIELAPDWTHGLALKISLLDELKKQGSASAGERLDQFAGEAQTRLAKGVESARDYFIVGYHQLAAFEFRDGNANLERSLRLAPDDCETMAHLGYGYVGQAGQQKLAGELGEIPVIMGQAWAVIQRAHSLCPADLVVLDRVKWIREHFGVFGLPAPLD